MPSKTLSPDPLEVQQSSLLSEAGHVASYSPNHVSGIFSVEQAIIDGGGIPKGSWPAIPGKTERLYLFNSKFSDSTLALYESKLIHEGAEGVRRHIAASDLLFVKARERAA